LKTNVTTLAAKQRPQLQKLKLKQQQQQQQPQRRMAQVSSLLRAKMAMQNAKKNMIKAKQRMSILKQNKGPIQQIMVKLN
jgi:hypothetical protein